MRDLNAEKKWVDDYLAGETLVEDLEVIYEFYKEKEASEEDLENRHEKALGLIEDLELKMRICEKGIR